MFNELSKYKQYKYPDFKVHAGIDYGDEDEAKNLNISEISFEDVKVRLDFSGLSLSGKNKKFTGGVLCADIRGFTKLFNKSDNNLQEARVEDLK